MRDGKERPSKDKVVGERRSVQTGGSEETGVSSTDTVVGSEEMEQVRESGEAWNKRRHQREDEVLWGLEAMDTRSSVGMTPVEQTASGSSSQYRYYARNPAINDLHPPVVSATPPTMAEAQWMLQPPPRAKIMDGKERGNTPPGRSRSGSGGTNASKGSLGRVSDHGLGKQVSQRLVESKLRRGEQPRPTPDSAAMSRDPSLQTNAPAVPSQNHDRDITPGPLRSSESLKHQKPPRPPSSLPTQPSYPSPSSPRPPLSTIPSSSVAQNQNQNQEQTANNKTQPQIRPLLFSTNSASSLHKLQDLVVPANQFSILKTASAPIPDAAVQVKLPPVSRKEGSELGMGKWAPRDGLGDRDGWEFERMGDGRENYVQIPGHRWSMDI